MTVNKTIRPFLVRTLCLFMGVSSLLRCQAQETILHTLQGPQSSLQLYRYAPDQYGVRFLLNSSTAQYGQQQPIAVEVVTENGNAAWYTAAYSALSDLGGQQYLATGALTSPNGSVFAFADTFRLQSGSAGVFTVSRQVKVVQADSRDKGFSTRMAFERPQASALENYDMLVPSVWYRNNADVPPHGLAANYTDNYFWFREDRLPLPFILLQEKASGLSFSVGHQQPDGSSFRGEDGLNRIIDARMQFASLGLQHRDHPLVGMLYPGTEGERTGIYGMQNVRKWAYRSHPVQTGFVQAYTAGVRLQQDNNYTTALANAWKAYYQSASPALYNVDMEKVYTDHIGILDQYWREINGTSGVPFRILLNGTLEASGDYNWNMGFVGQQTGNAALLLREGNRTNDAQLSDKGRKMADFWASQTLSPLGIPRTWYDPAPRSWRDMASHLRTIGDGMNGLLWAWNMEKKAGRDQAEWLYTCARVADWLLSIQQADGSFLQQYNFSTGALLNDNKSSTSNVIPFLTDLYMVTGTEKYRTAALAAGNYIYQDIHLNFRYVAGAQDNPNVPDKEAASMALRAFTALYDLNLEQRWLYAALQTAYYYQTWVYAWDVPIPADDNQAVFPYQRSVTGMSAIATANNAADSYAAVDAFLFYRMYLYGGDEQLLQMAQLLLRNTKQFVNWDPANPLSKLAPGFLGEAITIIPPRGHGVNYYLPWQTFNLLEPMVMLQDVFGTMDIDAVQQLAAQDRQTKHAAYAQKRGFEAGVVTSTEQPKPPSPEYRTVTVSKALSPNGDGINDYLVIQHVQYAPENRLEILHPGGKKVASITNYDNETRRFKGEDSQGKALPAGTYYYLFEYRQNGQRKLSKGYFVLKR
ncbi:MAG: gliding motility-associated C-terminal domain-containing protein [Candidatus Pseudobacter hemicellulosilyticus]|uniref:Gliding motility-associated C-terminal domain-containing protein n=1 Tax=Candidatus Pseudobacter hemicellulosilyticus TaxID=3121375 RepID=A0AAJ6BHJ0_9BACT|nr:MAG: gliding motility-associated C-terminal domain-containing protein [Pseudobacter sp.]